MLGPEMTLRPAVARFEFHSKEISNFPENAILNHPQQFAIGVAHPQRSTLRHRPVYLQARARKRYVLQIGHTTPGTTALVLPLYVHQVRTEHPRFNTPIEHFSSIPSLDSSIGRKLKIMRAAALDKIALSAA
jgi:hypothetical protein